MPGYDDTTASTWTCSCGKTNIGKFCVKCGSARPVAPTSRNTVADGKGGVPVSTPAKWVCTCGESNTGNFCVKCGASHSVQKAETHEAAQEAVKQDETGRKAAEAQKVQEAEAHEAAQEAVKQDETGRKAAEAPKAQEAEVREAAEKIARQEAAAHKEEAHTASVTSVKTNGNNDILKKAAIGVAVLLVLKAKVLLIP